MASSQSWSPMGSRWGGGRANALADRDDDDDDDDDDNDEDDDWEGGRASDATTGGAQREGGLEEGGASFRGRRRVTGQAPTPPPPAAVCGRQRGRPLPAGRSPNAQAGGAMEEGNPCQTAMETNKEGEGETEGGITWGGMGRNQSVGQG